jgi:hypothetical protein
LLEICSESRLLGYGALSGASRFSRAAESDENAPESPSAHSTNRPATACRDRDPSANRVGRKSAKTSRIRCRGLRLVAEGSAMVRTSPEELCKSPQIGASLSGPLARSTACGRYGAVYGALRSRS